MYEGRLYEGVDSAMPRIAIFSNFIKLFIYTGVNVNKVQYFKVKVSFY